MNEILHIDNLDWLRGQADNSWDLLLCDPGFGDDPSFITAQGRKKARVDKKNTRGTNVPHNPSRGYDMSKPPSEYWEQVFRVTKHQVIKGGNYFTNHLPETKSWIFWDKCNGGCDQADGELLWTSFDKALRIFKFMWAGFCQGKSVAEGHLQKGNKSLNEKKIHIHQTPWQVWYWVLQNYAQPGWKILDTHSGSGSVARACVRLGFDFIALEREQDFVEDSREFLSKTVRDMGMFVPDKYKHLIL